MIVNVIVVAAVALFIVLFLAVIALASLMEMKTISCLECYRRIPPGQNSYVGIYNGITRCCEACHDRIVKEQVKT